jgi:hypothetical protein
MRNGIAYLLPPLAPLIDEIGFGLLPTPAASPYGTSNNGDPGDGRGQYRLKGKPSLETMASRNLWPTPRAEDGESTGMSGKRLAAGRKPDNLASAVRWPTPKSTVSGPDYARLGRPSSDGGDDLVTAVARESWPSPAARDWRSGRGRLPNGHAPQLPEVAGGQLNPSWVEWLMGLPEGWTVASGSSPSATVSSRRSRKSSAKPSSNTRTDSNNE